jgi:hypothetical protein
MRSVDDLLICCFPSLNFQGCVVHCLDLLLEDWGKATWAKQNVKNMKVEFWDICANFVHMVEPVLMSLRAFDGK